MLFGAHCSTAGGVHTALERAREIGGDICQIFVKSNMQWFGKPPSTEQLALYRARLAETGIARVFGHAGYLINLAAPASKNREISIRSLIQEIEFATLLDLPFLVMHPGAHLGAGEQTGLEQCAAGLNEVLSATKHSAVRVAFENTAGQGSCLGHCVSHLASIYDRVDRPERLAVCLDTAHLFAAGYDIRKLPGWEKTIKEVSKFIGLRQIVAFHLNDSKTALGSRVDRHAHIGEGWIGKSGFHHIVNDARFKKTPGCLETPKSKDLKEDIRNLATLRSLVGKPAPARSSNLKPLKA